MVSRSYISDQVSAVRLVQLATCEGVMRPERQVKSISHDDFVFIVAG